MQRELQKSKHIYFLSDFLDQCNGKCLRTCIQLVIFCYQLFTDDIEFQCSISEVCVFFTGASRPPPLGFSPAPKLKFLHGERLPTGSTCYAH